MAAVDATDATARVLARASERICGAPAVVTALRWSLALAERSDLARAPSQSAASSSQSPPATPVAAPTGTLAYDDALVVRHTLSLDLDADITHPYAAERAEGLASRKLCALATLLAHSSRLRTHVALKTRFWTALLGSEMVRHTHDRAGVERWGFRIAEDADSAAAVFFSLALLLSPASLTESAADALVRFFTTAPSPSPPGTSPSSSSSSRNRSNKRWRMAASERQERAEEDALPAPPLLLPPIDIRVKGSHETDVLPVLQLLETTLDRVFASPTRHFEICSLDLGDLSLVAPRELPQVLRLLAKCRDVYAIGSVSATSTALALDALAAGCSAADLVPLAARPAREQLSCLKHVRLAHRQLGLAGIAAMCSALRYGTHLESISLPRALAMLPEREDRELGLRWLMFGLFCPLSRQLVGGERRLPLVWSAYSTMDSAASELLADPLGALLRGYSGTSSSLDNDDTGARRRGQLVVCTVKHGARFRSRPSDNADVVCSLNSDDCELEAIVLQRLRENDGSVQDDDCSDDANAAWDEEESGGAWMCVVLPGFGLGWVKRESVLRVDRSRDEDTRGNVELAVSSSWNQQTAAFEAAFFPLLAFGGARVRSLTFSGVTSASAVTASLRYCAHLKVLDLNFVSDAALAALLDALESELGGGLRSITVDVMSFLDCGLVERLERCLSDSAVVPVLSELQLLGSGIDRRVLVGLGRALRVNKTLELVRLRESEHRAAGYRHDDSGGGDGDGRNEMELELLERQSIQKEFHGEVLVLRLPLPCKLALLSVLRDDPQTARSTTERMSSSSPSPPLSSPSPRCGIDSFMVATILQFAASRVRRRVVWK